MGSHLWILELSQLHAANQRTKRTDADGSYWDYGYDSLGQVTNAVRRWSDGALVAGQQYGYLFDDIGNRQRSEVSGLCDVFSAVPIPQDGLRHAQHHRPVALDQLRKRGLIRVPGKSRE